MKSDLSLLPCSVGERATVSRLGALKVAAILPPCRLFRSGVSHRARHKQILVRDEGPEPVCQDAIEPPENARGYNCRIQELTLYPAH